MSLKITARVYKVGGGELTSPEDAAVYLVDGGSELALIDAGSGKSVDRIVSRIQESGFEPAKVAYIVATHGHIDHIGGLAWLRERLGSRVVCHELDLVAVEKGEPKRTAADMYGLAYRPCLVDVVMEGEKMSLPLGEISLHLLHTPGHTPGSICVWMEDDGERVLFGQDLHGPFHPNWGSDEAEWRKSLKKLLSLEADILCEGHFGVYKGKEKVARYIRAYLFK